jgi:hypothetical protein
MRALPDLCAGRKRRPIPAVFGDLLPRLRKFQ